MPQENGNAAAVRAYVAALNAGDWDALRRIFAAGATIQGVTGTVGIDAVLAEGSIWHQLHSGLNMVLEIEDLVIDGDRGAARYRERGKWTGPFLDKGAPNGRSYELLAMEWFEFSEGRITRRWGARDSAAQARQLGFEEPA